MLQLQPLLIIGLFFRWNLDFAQLLPITLQHNIYVSIMIEHFSKLLEVVALPEKFNIRVAYAFLMRPPYASSIPKT